MAKVGCVCQTHWGRTEQLSVKSAQSITNTQHLSMKKSKPIFQCTRRILFQWIKNTLAKSTTVSERSCQDDGSPWLHTSNAARLQLSVRGSRDERQAGMAPPKPGAPRYNRVLKKKKTKTKKIKTACQLVLEVTFKNRKKKLLNAIKW